MSAILGSFAYAKERSDKMAKAASPVANPAKAGAPAAKKNDSPKQKEISPFIAETVLQIHDSLHKKRYGSYRYFIFGTGLIAAMLYIIAAGFLVLAIPIAIISSYYYTMYKVDHDKYKSWSKRAAVIPTMLPFDDKPTKIPLMGLQSFLDPKAPRTLVD